MTKALNKPARSPAIGSVERFVALFRGINVGKAKRLAMADLRALLQTLGYREVKTLLNSGNVVFDAHDGAAASVHAERIHTAVASELGVDARVIVKSAEDIAGAIAGSPQAADNPSHYLVALTDSSQSLQGLSALAKGDWGDERLHIGPHAAYLLCPAGLMASKLAVALLRDLGQTGTTRNWATLEKINALLQA